MSYLYVNEQGARIGVDGGYVTVQMKDDLLRKIPSRNTGEYFAFRKYIDFYAGHAAMFEAGNHIEFLFFKWKVLLDI